MENNESPELIEQRMQETRNSLTEKVSMLEDHVVGTVQTATSAVKDTVETVKDTVQDMKSAMTETVSSVKDTVKQTFDISSHVRDYPWAMVGGATALGFVTGLFVSGRRESSSGSGSTRAFEQVPRYNAEPMAAAPASQTSSRPGWLDKLLERAGDELYKLGESALNQALTSLQQSVHQNVPKLIDNVQNRLMGNEETSTASRGVAPDMP